MAKMRNSIKMRGMCLLHFCLTTGIMMTAWFLWCVPQLEGEDAQTVCLAVCACYVVVSSFLYRTYNVYQIGIFRAGEIFFAQLLANLFSNGITYLFACIIQLRLLNILPVFFVLCVQTFVCAVWCLAANKLYFQLHPPMRTLVIYETNEDLSKLSEMLSFEKRFRVRRKIEAPESIHDILPQLEGQEAVVIAGIEATMRNGVVKACIDRGVNCYFIPHIGDILIAGAQHLQSFSIPIMSVKRAMPRPEYAIGKRAVDIVLALIGIIISSPLMLIITIAVKACDHGPVLYKQIRLTEDGKRFQILKFRSMQVDAERDGIARLATEHDDRVTAIGRILRAVHLDELPQLFNILCGDMSFVGPRPERPEIAKQYEQLMPTFNLRLQVKAGLTGMAQVYGRYNTEPKDKLKMDLMYINQMSLVEDLKLFFATVRILFMPESTEGVSEGQTTAMSGENH